MSEETPQAKKAARKTVRKKKTSKRVSKKSPESGEETTEKLLPLVEETGEASENEKKLAAKREPKSGVRDARREMADEIVSEGASESSESSEDSGDSTDDKKGATSSNSDQEKSGGNERRSRSRGRRGGEKREPRPKIVVDTKDLAQKAWKIFESEVTEEGLALLDDNGLREYARNSFNAARFFLEEKERIFGREKQAKEEAKKRETEAKKLEKKEAEEKDDD